MQHSFFEIKARKLLESIFNYQGEEHPNLSLLTVVRFTLSWVKFFCWKGYYFFDDKVFGQAPQNITHCTRSAINNKTNGFNLIGNWVQRGLTVHIKDLCGNKDAEA